MTSKTTSWGLIISCIVLAAALFLPYQSDGGQSVSTSSELEIQPVSLDFSPSQLYLPDELHRYSSITEFPLFNPLRKLIKKEPVQIAQTVERRAVKVMPNPPELIGVMKVNNVDVAFVLGKGDSEVVSLEQGEKYKDWTLTAIDATQIVMSYEDNETVIGMNWLGKDILQAGRIGEEARKQVQNRLPSSRQQQNPQSPSIEVQERLARQLENSI